VSETLRNCALCSSPKLKRVFYRAPYGISKCSDCGLIFTDPRPTADETSDLYGENYMANLESVRSILTRICENRLSFVEKFKKGGKLLDIGSGCGYFLEAARKRGWTVFGTEMSDYCIKYSKEEFEISIESGEIFETNFPTSCFDIITMWHTLEHVRAPLDYLLELNRILKNDGLIFILVPNRQFLVNYLKGWSWIAKTEIMEHFYFFSTKTLEAILNKAGFKIVDNSTGNIEYIRNCLRQKAINAFSVVGRAFYFLSGINFAESIQIVARKVG